MSGDKSISKRQLLKAIDELQRKPNDRGRILGDIGITGIGVGLGAAAAGTVAAVAGATAIPALTTAASWVGITAVATTPIGWLAGVAIGGGALAYGVSRLIRGGGISEGRKRELSTLYKERLREIKQKEQRDQIGVIERNQLIEALRELIDKDAITPQKAFALIDNVENGRMKISEAYTLVVNVLKNSQSISEKSA